MLEIIEEYKEFRDTQAIWLMLKVALISFLTGGVAVGVILSLIYNYV